MFPIARGIWLTLHLRQPLRYVGVFNFMCFAVLCAVATRPALAEQTLPWLPLAPVAESAPSAAPHVSNGLQCMPVEQMVLVGDAADQFQWALRAAQPQPAPLVPPPLLPLPLLPLLPSMLNAPACVSPQHIAEVMKRIQNALIAEGFTLAQVLLGLQPRLHEGILELTLVPGRIQHVGLTADSTAGAHLGNALPLVPGDIFNLRHLEQGLDNLKRLPSVEASVDIRPAEGAEAKPGHSQVLVRWQQKQPWRVALGLDDAGTQTTGRYQGSVSLAYDHLFGLNDLFFLSVNQGLGGGGGGSGPSGTRANSFQYAVPWRYWLFSVATSRNRFHQTVAGDTQSYLYSGINQNAEVKVTRTVYRDESRYTTASVYAWARNSSNFIDDTEIEIQRRRMAGWGLALNHRQQLGSRALDIALNHRRGTGARGALPAPEEAFGQGTSRPKLLTLDAQLQQPLVLAGKRLRHVLVWRGQWSQTALVPQDRFALGGRYTVRGFDGNNQLLADRGWLLRNDLGWALGQAGAHELYLGVDNGRVSGPSSQLLAGDRLTGAVVGMRGQWQHLNYDVFAGAPIRNPSGFDTASAVFGFNLGWSF